MLAVTLNLLFPHSISRTESEFENSAMTSIKQEGLPLIDPSKIELRRETAVVLPGKRRGAHAALGYMCSAVLLVLFNKAALSSYSFPYVNVITLFQMLSSCAFLYAMKRWKIISFSEGEPQSVTSNPITLIPLRTLVHTLPLAVSYLLYMLITMESVRGINVPMYTTLRRTTVAFTMIVEYLLTGRKHSSYIVGSVGIIILGAFVAGARDLSFDAYSYSIVFMANICSAVYLASIAHIGKSSGLNSFGLMWCNGIICAPILLLWTSFKGDLEALMSFPYLYSSGFQVVMLLSCIMAFLINYYVFLNTTLNSALTQTICGNLKDLFTIGFGWLLFGGLPFDLMNVVGQSLGFLGSCLYAYCKLKGK
ncbi:hypothetical protein E1A91_A05G016400v1 [Gossypium mustelinum]|uniref:Sugar phosphate transporter domain-containing protein n=3 Tax=Gossypium TaxID=3633 RepID=A0A5D2Z042_GOSMU|nr:hypothetical protein ES288_A05G016500v1 [Gossypium darwinii]TYI24896.1 hypothetical protein ES332_A05G016800v1 [Gossypium tomentosum]TYJ32135.1 hypothetical protein E1A91_A05G016400v1 [Gossypium mustelinum]